MLLPISFSDNYSDASNDPAGADPDDPDPDTDDPDIRSPLEKRAREVFKDATKNIPPLHINDELGAGSIVWNYMKQQRKWTETALQMKI